MPQKPPLEPHQLQLLRENLTLLHHLFHRNKNQHRLLKWWQWIATLRRNLNKLLDEHDRITTAKNTPQRDSTVSRFKERLIFLRRIVIPSAYKAFGTVIAMKGFAALGLVLMGILARVWKFVRPTKAEIEAEMEKVEVEMEKINEGKWIGVDPALDKELGEIVPRDSYIKGKYEDEETGVAVSRIEYEVERDDKSIKQNTKKMQNIELLEGRRNKPPKVQTDMKQSTKKKTNMTLESGKQSFTEVKEFAKQKRKLDSVNGSNQRKPTKKKRGKKGKDDIDDLFSGFL